SRGLQPIASLVAAPLQLARAGLLDAAARALLADRAGLSGAAADHLLRVAGGNPLALLELPELVGTAPPADDLAPPPVGPRVNQAFRARLDALPEPARLPPPAPPPPAPPRPPP